MPPQVHQPAKSQPSLPSAPNVSTAAATPIATPPIATAPAAVSAPASLSSLASDRFSNSIVLRQILSKLDQNKASPYSGPNARGFSAKAFENHVNRLLDELFPFAVLPGIRLFSSEPRGRIDYGFEMDNLLHFRHQEIDYLVEIEVKHQPVLVERNRWTVRYDDGPSCAREQVDNHIRTMWEYLRPIARQTELKFMAIVVSSDVQTAPARADGYRNAELYLRSVKDLPAFLAERFNFIHAPARPKPEVLRVPQSGFLDLLRLSLPVEQLGHPELSSAIRYVERCRRTLDETLFQKFNPTPERWVINGSAGMGKSVLLAYAAAVLSSGFELYRALGVVGVKPATETFTKIRFRPDPKRGSIAIMAMSAKQLDNIRAWFNLFVEQFQQADVAGNVRFRPPEFVLCRPGASISGLADRCSALLVDEAHDIPPFAARDLAELNGKSGLYLVVACDRHQKLRLAGSDARIIEGLDFTNRSTRLRQIYRNPAPVYIASLGLMFRWFADSGPKVVPTQRQLEEEFGFDVTNTPAGLQVLMRSDAHPANSWCHTVASFPDAAAVYSALLKEKIGHKDVLWVRFSQEDPDFDYEQLNKHFTYHNCRDREAHKISDKYIKGQDYPIVVIEGFPGFMDRFEATPDEAAEVAEARAWTFRRELYLCASRATGFLYFICNVPETNEIRRIQAELQKLIHATAAPENFQSGGTKSWRFLIAKSEHSRKVEVFADAVSEPTSDQTPAAAVVSKIPTAPSPVTTVYPVSLMPHLQPATTPITSTPVISEPPPAQGTPPRVAPPSAPPSAPSSAAAGRSGWPLPNPSPGVAPADAPPPKQTVVPQPVPALQASTSPNPAPLGEVASLADVATYLGKDIAEVTKRMARQGIPVPNPATKVNVTFVVDLFNVPSQPSPQPIFLPAPQPRLSAKASNISPKPPSSSQPQQPRPTIPASPQRQGASAGQHEQAASADAIQKRSLLVVRSGITVAELAVLLGVKTFVIVADLLSMRKLFYAHQVVSERIVRELCFRRGFDVEFIPA